MKFFVAFFALVAVAVAEVSYQSEKDAVILEQDADVFPDQFRYRFGTSNGINAEAVGVLKNVGTEGPALVISGSNAYTGPNGAVYSLTFEADENGYRARGDHLPTPPPPQETPEYILRAQAYINAHPPKPEGVARA